MTQFYKERETQEQLERDSLKAATAVFYDIIDTCDKRHFYALRLWAAYQNYLPPEQIAAAWKRYDDVVISWNEKLGFGTKHYSQPTLAAKLKRS